MINRGFGMGFFGRNPFDKEARNKIREEWSKMTDSEKLELANRRMNDFDNQEDRFSVEAIDARCEAWMKMTREEKEAFIDERKKAFEEKMSCMGSFFNRMHR